ncbi:hypothetical protein B0A55_03597 [Friedmanniomyces simplex]|uniref:Uncharacterized protein n=1 Tax=Friedmanniomyces simplex TaxID=329884 RepID=A0A4U0XRC6_9PEZI|nr:hypothetical protein B0A55_03597 [Friedmanniomyces simplex]
MRDLLSTQKGNPPKKTKMKFTSSLFALAFLAVLASARPAEPSPPKGPDYIAAEHTWNCQNGFMDFLGHSLGFCGDE